jgi:hypothetical protein
MRTSCESHILKTNDLLVHCDKGEHARFAALRQEALEECKSAFSDVMAPQKNMATFNDKWCKDASRLSSECQQFCQVASRSCESTLRIDDCNDKQITQWRTMLADKFKLCGQVNKNMLEQMLKVFNEEGKVTIKMPLSIEDLGILAKFISDLEKRGIFIPESIQTTLSVALKEEL